MPAILRHLSQNVFWCSQMTPYIGFYHADKNTPASEHRLASVGRASEISTAEYRANGSEDQSFEYTRVIFDTSSHRSTPFCCNLKYHKYQLFKIISVRFITDSALTKYIICERREEVKHE